MAKQVNDINTIVTKTASQWKERAIKDKNNRKNIARAQRFALELLEYLDDNNISQKQLAQFMGVSPQQVNKLVRAKSNLTFETLDKIEEALGVEITSPTIKPKRKIQSKIFECSMDLVHKSMKYSNKEDFSTVIGDQKNSIMEPSLDRMEAYRHTAEQS